MAQILCIRHGQASFASDDYDQLSETGYRQGRLLGEYLLKSGSRLDRFYAGTLKRQIQTAEAVREVFRENGLACPQVECDPRWNELESEEQVEILSPLLASSDPRVEDWMRHARTDKKAFQKLIRATFDFWINHSDRAPELESWPHAQSRVTEALHDVHQQNSSGSTVGVFSSGGIIAIVAAHLLNLPPAGVYPLFEKMINCSITRLLHNNDNISLSSFNEHSYLQAMAGDGQSDGVITYR